MDKGVVKGCAHITGGGFPDNVDRILPPGCDAVINAKSWMPLPIFQYLQRTGNVENAEMYRTFNMGIGMTVVVSPEDVDSVLNDAAVAEYEPVAIGSVVPGTGVVRMEF
jgi:phosphoribosylformylglycinamidine cyclo-ligase